MNFQWSSVHTNKTHTQRKRIYAFTQQAQTEALNKYYWLS